jgi:hypothetical protein
MGSAIHSYTGETVEDTNYSLSDLKMKKLKIEICDGNGDQVTVAMSGSVSKKRILQIIDLFDNKDDQKIPAVNNVTKTAMDKLLGLIKSKSSKSWFTSKNLSLMYREQYHESIKPSTMSTYLTRLYNDGYLERNGNRSCWQYHVVMTIYPKNVKKIIEDIDQI